VINPRDPVFISYRQSDGSILALDTAWALRAAGVPVWHDKSDLPPGETRRRLEEALASGLSGAVLLVTPDIQYSSVVREVELPRLLSLARDDRFTFSIGSTVRGSDGGLDYAAPDKLLQQNLGTLRSMMQQPVATPHKRATLAHDHARRRIQAMRPSIIDGGGLLRIDVQTRIPPFASRADSEIVLRLRPPLDGQRRPHRQGLEDLQHFLGRFPQLVALAGATNLCFLGGSHLSVAFALGSAVPTTLFGAVDVVDTGGSTWTLTGNARAPIEGQLIEVLSDEIMEPTGPSLIYVDLLPTRSSVESLLVPRAVSRSVHLRPARAGYLSAGQASELVGELSHVIREIASVQRSIDVHLLLRCPWPVALLLGRTLNTLTCHLYEWEDAPSEREPLYVPSLIVRSGAGGSPIQSVTLPTGGTSKTGEK
jgi:hypothetical protein